MDPKDAPTGDRSPTKDEHVSRRRLLQFAGIGIAGAAVATTKGSAQESPDRLEILADGDKIEYTFTCGGRITAVQSKSVTSAEGNDTVVENDDGTWTATGKVGGHHGDAFDIEGDVHSLQPADGTYRLYLNGKRISHADLVQPPVEREHSYSFEGVGDSWADYYLEVEDGGDLIASTKDGAVIEPDFHWISADGTKAAGRVDPGERHAYEFDNLVLDVTIEGEADAYVDGSPSDTDRYPQPGATGDEWKGGFPWQDDASTVDGIALGGGPGYGDILTASDATVTVQTARGLADALSSASAGDVVFVAGDATIDTGTAEFTVPRGVTVASNRGHDGAPGALLYTDEEPDAILHLSEDDARVTGLRIRGAFPNSDVTYQNGLSYSNGANDGVMVSSSGAEVDNCEIYGHVHAGVYVESGDGSTHVHHNYIYQNNTQGLGYGVSVGFDGSADPLVEYNYFDENRHSVTSTGDNYGYTARYNHFGPTTVMHPIDIHDPGSVDTTIENNIVEPLTRTWDDNCCPAIDGFDDTEGVVRIRDNWFWNDTCTFDVPTSDSDIEVSDNDYDETATSFAAVIPDHPGASHRPWD